MSQKQYSWSAEWYEPDMVTIFSRFVGTSNKNPVDAAWHHFYFIRSASDKGVCTDGAYLELGKKFHPNGAVRYKGTGGVNSKDAHAKRAIVRTQRATTGHHASFQSMANLDSGEKAVIVANLEQVPVLSPLPTNIYWNGTPINQEIMPKSDLPKEHPDYGLHRDSCGRENQTLPTYKVVDMANAIMEFANPNATKGSAAKKFDVSHSSLQRNISDMEKESPVPTTLEEICLFVAKRSPMANREGCSEQVMAIPLTRQGVTKEKGPKAKKAKPNLQALLDEANARNAELEKKNRKLDKKVEELREKNDEKRKIIKKLRLKYEP